MTSLRFAVPGYGVLALLVVTALLALLVATTALGVVPAAPPEALLAGDLPAAALGVGLLVADAVVPVPSSAVMLAHGAAFGVLGGAALSTLGGFGAALVGFALGRRAAALRRHLPESAAEGRASRLVERWGAVAIVLTRPVPVLAETTAVVAGASPMRWPTLMIAAVAGSFPPALAYAAGGAGFRTAPELAILPAIVCLAAVVHRLVRRR